MGRGGERSLMDCIAPLQQLRTTTAKKTGIIQESTGKSGLIQSANVSIDVILPEFRGNKESIQCCFPTPSGETLIVPFDRNPYEETCVQLDLQLQALDWNMKIPHIFRFPPPIPSSFSKKNKIESKVHHQPPNTQTDSPINPTNPSYSRKSLAKHEQVLKAERRRKQRMTRKEKSDPGALDESSTILSEHDPGRDISKLVRDFQFDFDLNTELVAFISYFRGVERKVEECLESNAGTREIKSGLEELVKVRDILKKLIDQVESFYHEDHSLTKTMKDSLEFQEILKSTTKLQGVIEDLDNESIPKLLQATINKTNDHVLCSILGLTDEVADYLGSIDQDLRAHQADKEWIHNFFAAREKDFKLGETIYNKFIQLGFTPVKAEWLLNHLNGTDSIAKHQSILQWVEDHIDYQYKCNILLSGKPNFHITLPYNTTQQLGEEFLIPTKDREGAFQVKAIDIKVPEGPHLHKVPCLHDYLTQDGSSLETTTYWFHGTDHESAKNIIQGIKLKSRRSADFSSDSDGGFYIGTSYSFAQKWAIKKSPKSPAVLVFEVDQNKASNEGWLWNNSSGGLFDPSKGKEFATGDEEWEKLVTFFRKGGEGFDEEETETYEDLKWIFGPLAGDGDGFSTAQMRRPGWRPTMRPDPPEYQLCIKDKKLAGQFYNGGANIVKVIFLQ